eukprot:21482-Heterococcus_DN1.PRE.2
MAKRAQLQCAAADSSSMQLFNTGVLDLVLRFVGPGHYLIVGAVSKEWRDRYKTVSTVKFTSHYVRVSITYETTFCSAAFASPSLVRLARECGLDLSSDNDWQNYIAGKVADVTTLTVARELGLAFTLRLLCGAIESGCITKLSWLYTECDQNEWHRVRDQQICSYAVLSGSIEMMEWVVERGAAFDWVACDDAARQGDLAMLKWLCQRRCPWYLPRVIEYAAESGNIELLKYLRHQGHHDDVQCFAGLGSGNVSTSWRMAAQNIQNGLRMLSKQLPLQVT